MVVFPDFIGKEKSVCRGASCGSGAVEPLPMVAKLKKGHVVYRNSDRIRRRRLRCLQYRNMWRCIMGMRSFVVGIAVKNNLEAVEFYMKVFGLELGVMRNFPMGHICMLY